MLKNFSLDKTNGTKKYSFFFRELQLMKVLLLIRDLYIIRFRFAFNKVYFFQQEAWTLWLQNFIIPFNIKIIQKPHTVFLLHQWFLSCDKKFQNRILFASAGLPKKWHRDELFKLRKSKLWESHFFSMVTFW